MRNRREIERLVSDLLRKHTISSAPVRVEEVAKAEGLPIVDSPFPSDVSGALLRHGDLVAIAVNGRQSAPRKRFTVAHELAHYLLDHKDHDHIDWKFTVIRRDGKSSEASDSQEIEANAFAANLLMPKQFLLDDVKVYKNFNGEVEIDSSAMQSLARKYQVSEIALTYRLANLGLIDPSV